MLHILYQVSPLCPMNYFTWRHTWWELSEQRRRRGAQEAAAAPAGPELRKKVLLCPQFSGSASGASSSNQ